MTGRPPAADVRVGVVCAVGLGARRGGRARNEDNFLVCRDGAARWRDGDREGALPVHGEGVLVAVADGMGGAQDGDVASTTVVRVLAGLYRPTPRDPARALRRYVLEAHRRLRDALAPSGPVKMGSTLTACWLFDGYAAWVNVGDSRLYRWSHGELTRLSSDHTRGEFAARDRRGAVAAPDALAQGVIYGSRGLGDDAALRIDPERDADVFQLQPGDRVLLCTDGVHGAVDDAGLADVLRTAPDAHAAAEACVERALARGSTDNVTALVVDVR